MLYAFLLSALLLSATVAALPFSHSKISHLRPPTETEAAVATASAAPSCGLDSYDFSGLMTQDWAGLADDYSEIYYVNLVRNASHN